MSSEFENMGGRRAKEEAPDPEATLNKAILELIHAADPKAREELLGRTGKIRYFAHEVRVNKDRSPLALRNEVASLELRCQNIPKLTEHIASIRKAVNDCLSNRSSEEQVPKKPNDTQ